MDMQQNMACGCSFFFLMQEWMAANFGGATHALFDMCRPTSTSAAYEFKGGSKYNFSPKLKNQDEC